MRSATCALFAVALSAKSIAICQNKPELTIKYAFPSIFQLKYKLALEWEHRENLIFELAGSYLQHHLIGRNNQNNTIEQEYTVQRDYIYSPHLWQGFCTNPP